jgi:hypothetical protein
MKRGYVWFLLVLLGSCSKEVITQTVNTPKVEVSPFVAPVGSLVSMKYPKDKNGYYIVPLDPLASYTRFNVYVEATKAKPQYRANGVLAMQGYFDCDSYWLIANSLAVTIPLYSPFTSLSSNPYFNTKLSVRDTTVILSQFKNTMVSVVPPTGIYLKDYVAGNSTFPADEYMPTDTATRAWSKRIIGPIPSYFKGDTIKVYCRITWDLGQYSIDHPDLTNKLDSIKIIFK